MDWNRPQRNKNIIIAKAEIYLKRNGPLNRKPKEINVAGCFKRRYISSINKADII